MADQNNLSDIRQKFFIYHLFTCLHTFSYILLDEPRSKAFFLLMLYPRACIVDRLLTSLAIHF
jgi:hypothetical protein